MGIALLTESANDSAVSRGCIKKSLNSALSEKKVGLLRREKPATKAERPKRE